MITFDCEGCHQALNAPERLAGRRMKCPGCGHPVEVPALNDVVTDAVDGNVLAPMPEKPADKSSLEFDVAPPSYTTRRAKKSSQGTLVVLVLLLGLAAIGGFAFYKMQSDGPQLTLPLVNSDIVQELQPISFTITAGLPAGWNGRVRYELVTAPPGAALDPDAGTFTWTPTEEQGPGDYDFTIRASSEDASAKPAEVSFSFEVLELNHQPQIAPIEMVTAESERPLEFRIEAHDSDIPAAKLVLRIADGAPPEAKFDAATGEFRWTPQPEHEGREFAVIFEASEGEGGLKTTEVVHIHVSAPLSPSERIFDQWRAAGNEVQFQEYGSPLPIQGAAQVVTLNDEPVTVFEFGEDVARMAAAVLIKKAVKPADEGATESDLRFFQRERLVVVYAGDDADVLEQLTTQLQAPFATGIFPAKEPEPQPDAKPSTDDTQPASDTAQTELDNRVYQLFEDNLLLVPKRYPELREAYADYFAKSQAATIQAAFGDQHAEMTAWLDEQANIKQLLYTAINPETDNVERALQLFGELKQQFPEQIVPYANLAIAIAVTWDDEDSRGIYDYGHHQRRVHAEMPDDLVGAVENFRYFVDAKKIMQGRAQYLPWEFLTHLVNHRTPLAERQWAISNYLAQRAGMGKCYSDVPYDKDMLKTDDRICKMDGKEYTLANLKEWGGVCAQQADFAARVGKSLGVPAAYVRGEGNSGGFHAWVMWIELKRVTPESIDFELLSHGRYRMDQYYVGELYDPQSNQKITDRELELRLHVIGSNPQAHRQAALVMRAYPMIRDRAEMDTTQQLVFLRKVADLCPGLPETWDALASMSREGLITKKHSRQMDRSLELFFTTYAGYPDFTWTIFDDLIAHHPQSKDRLASYHRLVGMYEAAGRPDLACEARLKLSDDLVKADQSQVAIEGLAFTIKKFADEGRYVPRMLDRLEEICATVPGTDPRLVEFYQQFLPTIPTHRGNSPSDYCVAMLRRGIAFFEAHQQPQLAKQFQSRLAKLESGQ